MPLTDTINQMQSQGFQEPDIIQKLKEQGFSPKEIDDALSQNRIKSAVAGDYESNGSQSVIGNQEMQTGIMTQEVAPEPAPQEQSQEQYYSPPSPGQDQGQYQQNYYSPQPQISSDVITEVAEQIVSEKLGELKKTLSIIVDFKTTSDAKISGIDERLKRIESIISQLQSSIIRKIGDYGQAIGDLRDEISSTQESFSKVVSPLVEKARKQQTPVQESVPVEEEQEQQQEEPREQNPRKKKSKDGFENFLSR